MSSIRLREGACALWSGRLAGKETAQLMRAGDVEVASSKQCARLWCSLPPLPLFPALSCLIAHRAGG
eukprot:6184340-Pleurochrysis_carterae.AAC.1